MGFNKRYFNIKMLVDHYLRDPEKGVENAIGKTDGFIFCDDESKRVLDLWMEGKEKEANELLEKHVPRIITTTS